MSFTKKSGTAEFLRLFRKRSAFWRAKTEETFIFERKKGFCDKE